nr:hypothetical protein BaRGS_024975 [Batillaria attramentaria]
MQDLTERLKRRGVSHSGLDKNELAERLDDAIKKRKTEEPVLDEDQQAVVNRWEDEELLINAGPGSGKTTTVCALVAHILNERPDSRVLVLAYNRCASKELRCRLQKRRATLLQKTKAFNPELPPKGCLVSTFDSFGFWSVPGVEEKTKTKSWAADYRLLLEQSAKILGLLDEDNPARHWDWVVVDEAQDLNNTHASIVDTLRQSCHHLVVAGDPRQELYPGTTWFSEMWRKTPNEKRALLRYNYRSVPEIVDVINKFSSFNFPNLHHDQIAGRTDSSGSVEFCQVKSEECGEAAGERLSKSPPNEAYAIGPVSVHKFRTEPVTNTVRQVVHENNPGSHTFVFGEMNLPSFQIFRSECLRHRKRREDLKVQRGDVW